MIILFIVFLKMILFYNIYVQFFIFHFRKKIVQRLDFKAFQKNGFLALIQQPATFKHTPRINTIHIYIQLIFLNERIYLPCCHRFLESDLTTTQPIKVQMVEIKITNAIVGIAKAIYLEGKRL